VTVAQKQRHEQPPQGPHERDQGLLELGERGLWGGLPDEREDLLEVVGDLLLDL
jgi:hypothetical protein